MRPLSAWQRGFCTFFIAFALFFVTGCGGEPLPPETPASSRARALVIRVESSRGAERMRADLAVVDALRSAGYRIALDDNQQHDVTVSVDVETGQARVAGGLFVLRSPNAVRLTLTISAGRHRIEQLRAEFVADDGVVEASDLSDLVASFTASPRVEAFAVSKLEARAMEERAAEHRLAEDKKQAEVRREAERRAQEEEKAALAERERRERAEDATAWIAARAAACGAPTTVEACDGVRAYLAAQPAGQHAAEAQWLLRTSEGTIRLLRDDAAWASADPGACETPTKEDACQPVFAYLGLYPSGAHAERARTLLEKARPGLDKLRAAREAKAAREKAAEAARERAAVARDRAAAAAAAESAAASAGRGSGQVCCCDGSVSPTCTYVHRGCCSHHGGVCGCN